ncbi:Tryptophan synthase beta chain [Handroanthus impetiginosus]|uniref:Tryptophan synthase n=1 Tax=Handroanthus impetiginosus TaxID=429701 RepID=A0A2G9FZN5_9LAMI|nr:Tryptophan synthase beta chain [Handroanthus impetiginosus]
MACSNSFHGCVSFRYENYCSPICKSKLFSYLNCNWPLTVVKNKSSKVVRSVLSITQDTLTSKETNIPVRRLDILRLTDGGETEQVLFNAGKFGRFGGIFVPETLVSCLKKLEAEFNMARCDPEFQVNSFNYDFLKFLDFYVWNTSFSGTFYHLWSLQQTLRDYVGRETPLYFAQRLTDYYKNCMGEGPEIYLKREDLNHGGAHKINNAIAQAMLARRMGRKRVLAATGAGQHGVGTAAACAKLSLDCTILMGNVDMERQSSNMVLMKHLGAQVIPIEGTFKDATSEAIRNWVGDLDNSYYLSGTAVGPHPCPSMVREFQSVIGKETRKQAMEKWGGKPDVVVACVGSGSNALGIFHEFVRDEDVRLIGIEAAGTGIDSGKHSATLAKGEIGVYHGARSYLLQDDDGQIIGPHSIGVGLHYPGVGPELSFLKDIERAEFYTVIDKEALDAYALLCRLEGIFPALEVAHAFAYLGRLCKTLPNGTKVVVNCSGRGDKDADVVFKHLQEQTSDGIIPIF